jgi:hypothetical protein
MRNTTLNKATRKDNRFKKSEKKKVVEFFEGSVPEGETQTTAKRKAQKVVK